MALSREEVEQIAKSAAQTVLQGLHRYAVDYKEPGTIEQGLQDSMIEERTAADWYRKRAGNAEAKDDLLTAALYQTLTYEEDHHYNELNDRLQELSKELTPATITLLATTEDNPGTPEVSIPDVLRPYAQEIQSALDKVPSSLREQIVRIEEKPVGTAAAITGWIEKDKVLYLNPSKLEKGRTLENAIVHEVGHLASDIRPMEGLPLGMSDEWYRTQGWELRRGKGGVYREPTEPSKVYNIFSPQEDFAEAFADYILSPESLKSKSPEAFNFMQKYFATYKVAIPKAETQPVFTKHLSHKEFIASGGTEAEWDIYAAEQNRLSRERGQQRTIELWQGEGISGNDVANLLRIRGVTIPPSISQGLQHNDTVVSSTSVTGRGMSRTEASTIHKWVSEQLAKPAIPKAESTPSAHPEVSYKPSFLREQGKEPWQMTQREWIDGHVKSPGMHREHVRLAISAGKPVPPEVLKDYPEFQKLK